MAEEAKPAGAGTGDPAAEAAVQAKIDAAVKVALEKVATKPAAHATAPETIMGRMRNGAAIDDAQLEKQLALLNENPAYADALLNRLGISRQLNEAEQIRAELAQTRLDIQREKIIAKHKLPEDLAQFVTGKSPEEMDANAKKLAASLEAAQKKAAEVEGEVREAGSSHSPAFIPPMHTGGNGKPEAPEDIAARIKANWSR
jgi:hypothetical protein